jgi:hypothetical protein
MCLKLKLVRNTRLLHDCICHCAGGHVFGDSLIALTVTPNFVRSITMSDQAVALLSEHFYDEFVVAVHAKLSAAPRTRSSV